MKHNKTFRIVASWGSVFALFLVVGCSTHSAPDAPSTSDVPVKEMEKAGEPESEAPEATEETMAERKLSNTLRWSTASEVENFGFDVYRGDLEEGPFVRLNKKPIPGAGTTDLPSKYVYDDDTIEAGKAYWYYVESIAMDGEREHFTPTFQAKAKTLEDEE
ncbi:MAG: hypothetical protein K0U98_01945 [Deltaproteobacteria bacterium]|nr:hypothetical protein [Deltaproteobacteria bacterium]